MEESTSQASLALQISEPESSKKESKSEGGGFRKLETAQD